MTPSVAAPGDANLSDANGKTWSEEEEEDDDDDANDHINKDKTAF